MPHARSVAASVVALGFAGTMAAPLPVLAAPGCARPEHYAAQSGAELLRINRLDLGAGQRRSAATPTETPSETSDDTGGSPTGSGSGKPTGGTAERGAASGSGKPSAGTAERGTAPGKSPDADLVDEGEHRARTLPAHDADFGGQGGGADNPALGDVGLGNARTVLISDGPVNSAGAARVLNGKVAGATERNDMVVQQAPPVSPKADQRRTGSRTYGPVKVGAGALSARAVWAAGMECGAVEGTTSAASAEISRVTIAGGGSGALVRVPERISTRSSTALRQQGGTAQTVATASITAGRISLVDNEVRIRVLRAPELRVSVAAGGAGRVDYQPAIVEITSRGGKQARLTTAGDHVDITLSEEMRTLESVPARLVPIGKLPLPTVPNLPVPGEPESTPVPAGASGSTLRISIGAARQATEGDAIAAQATAIRVTVVRNGDKGQTKPGKAPSGVVADLGIGMLEAAAVAPGGGTSGGGASDGNTSGQGVFHSGNDAAGLPITGPRVVSLLFAGAALVISGVCVVVMTARRRRRYES